MNRKLFSIGLACLIALFLIPHFGHAQQKITGPWLWMIAPTEPEQGGAESIDIDSLAVASGGAVTEADVAANGANEGDRVGNYVWTLGQISATGGDNINECLNQIGLTDGDVNNHSSYALFTFKSDTAQNNVTMRVGSDDAIKIWLNGEVVHTNPVNRGSYDFQDAFPINLVAGDNLLMVKVSELFGGWSMFVGIDTATTYVGIDAVSGVSSDDGQIQDPDVRRPIVQVVYRPVPGSAPRPNVNAEIDGLIKKAQRFFADEMERHGFGRKTFQIEVDTSGNTVVHRGELGNPGKNFFVYMEGGNQVQVQGICGYGGPSDWEGHAGHTTIYCWDWKVVAHELGHAFGLPHDFRAGSDRYIMSYGGGARRQLSDGAAEWLDAHRAFNPATGKSATNERTKIEMLPPSFAAPPNAIRLRFKVNDTDGLHQAQLLTPTLTGLAAGSPELLNYKGLNGSTNTTVEFVTGLTPNNLSVSLMVIDVHSNFTIDEFPINVTSLLPQAKVVSIPDANLAAAVRQTLGLSSSETLTTHAMLKLSGLDGSNRGITDLTGLEHAHNLRSLNLENEFIEGDGFVNSRTVLDLSPLSGLTNLTSLQLSGNNISDIAALSALKNLDTLDLSSNNISDVSPLSELAYLTSLDLSSNNISDVSPLSELAYLTSLDLSSNNISDVSPLSGLTNLTLLRIDSNTLSDISPLSALKNLNTLYLHFNNISDISPLLALNLTGTEWDSTGLYLWNNPLSWTSINTHIPTMQAKGIEISYDQRTPTKLIKISGDAQQAVNNAELPLPFVVQVQDEYNRPFAEVPVTFAITEGSGKLSTLTAKTDIKGWAKVRFTLGQTEGETTIRATVPKISQPIHFTVTAIRPTAFVQLLDTNLTAKIAETLGKPTNASITVADMLTLTSLTANNTSISDLTGLQHASNLTTLMLDGNNLSTIDLLTGLTQLTTLSLESNNLSDIAPLIELTQLETLSLENNNLSDITPLTELTQLKTLRLRGNLLNHPSLYTIIPTLRSRGVDVVVDTRTPTTLINIPGTSGVAGAAGQVAVHVQDQNGDAFAGVPVNFTLTAAGGHRFTSNAITNLNGKAATTLTLGPEPGENTVSATVSEIPQPLTFTITAIDANTPVHIPDVNLHAKMAETLNKPKNETLKAGDLLELISLSAPNANIQDLSGLEYAQNLRYLNLREEYISGEGWVNSSTVSDLSPLSGLTNLTSLELDSNNISDVSPLSELVYLTSLNLNGNNISDITPLSALTNLTSLELDSNNISDVSALSELAYLTWLNLSSNNISDITPLSALTNLTLLNLSSNTISDITPLSGLTNLTLLYLWQNTISDISKLSGLTNLTSLYLWQNTISDITPLSGLTNLNTLNLDINNISDLSPLSELTQLTVLRIHSNNISDISPLLALNLTGTEWDSTGLYLRNNPLSYVSINTHIPAMQAKGVEIAFDNRTHSALVKISGDTQEGEGGTTLENPFVVEALDEHGVPITGLGVTFRVIEGEGHLSATTALTDADGKAQKTLTLGTNPGVIKVRVTAAGITSPVTFTATVTEVSRLAADVNGDGTVNIQDLVLVASSFGQNGQNRADVNGDGDVNIQDLVMVAGALGEGAAASPALHPSDLARLTAAQVQDLLTQARQMAFTDPAYLRGIAVLEQLLALLQPRETALLPNYPNPFNPETWIPYQLAEPAEVTIRIYAVDGSLVRVLSLGHKATGSYQTRTRAAHWDGRNSIGEPVASGVYFYTLSTESTRDSVTAGDFTATRKMLIRK